MEKELLKIKREFSPKYILTEKLLEVYLFFGLLIAICFSIGKILYAVVAILVLILVIFIKLVLEKRKSNQSVMKFYKDKIEFKGKILFKTEQRVLKYDEIKDLVVNQGIGFIERRFQKAFGFGNIYVYPKKGTFITNGMQLDLVANINDRVEEIKKIIGDKIK